MDNDGGSGEQLAQWLKEAGRRAGSKAAPAAAGDADDTFNSPASLHRYLEELAGRPLQSHAEVLVYLREVAGTQPDAHRAGERRRMVREVSLLFLLALSYLHFYYWQVQLEIAALQSVSVFIPAPEGRPQKRSL
jgi:hypothetical protein